MKMSHNAVQRTKKAVKPVANRVIVTPLIEQRAGSVLIEMKQQVWKGKVVSVGEDVDFVKPGNFIRFQPMKRRYDSFRWNGRELYAIEDKWIYTVEREDGVPLYVNGNRVVLRTQTEKWEFESERVALPVTKGEYDRARVVLAASHLKEIKTKDIVWVQRSEFWQFYRVCDAWLYVSDISNLLCVEE